MPINHGYSSITAPAIARRTCIVLLALALSACGATLPRLAVQGEILGEPLHSTVDSPLARYYLENYLSGQRTHPAWDSQLDRLHAEPDSALTNHARLRSLSRQYSVDTIALFFALRQLQQEPNQQLQAEFRQALQQFDAAQTADAVIAPEIRDRYRIVFVPGWLYRSKPWTGADFAGLRAVLDRLGIEHHLIELLDNGPIEDNARLVALGLAPLLEDGKPVIVVSGSKGGPEVAAALGELIPAEQTASIQAWVNICGALQGSPLADQWTSWPMSWVTNPIFRLRGWGGLAGLESMQVLRSARRSARLSIPDHILTVNYVGVPVSGTIIEKEFEKRFTYMHLRRHGPNDGLVLIPDEIAPNSITAIELGLGHFLSEPDFDVRTTALLQVVMQRLANPERHANPAAAAAAGAAP